VTIENDCGQDPGGSAIPVGKRVDTQEIDVKAEGRYDQVTGPSPEEYAVHQAREAVWGRK
jgi:hypothetical protein